MENRKRNFSTFLKTMPSVKCIETFLASNNLTFLADRKDLLAGDSNAHFVLAGRILVLKNFSVFFKTSKLIKFRRLLSSSSKSFKLTSLNSGQFFNLKVLNGLLNKSLLINDYTFFSRYQQLLFSKNFNLFLDLVKVTNLLCQNAIELKFFVHLLSVLFRNMHKRQHNKFIFFVSNLFKHILRTYPSIVGLRLEINGRLLGKPRASSIKIEQGFLGLHSFSLNKYTHKTHVYTVYGVFGFTCFINFKNNN